MLACTEYQTGVIHSDVRVDLDRDQVTISHLSLTWSLYLMEQSYSPVDHSRSHQEHSMDDAVDSVVDSVVSSFELMPMMILTWGSPSMLLLLLLIL